MPTFSKERKAASSGELTADFESDERLLVATVHLSGVAGLKAPMPADTLSGAARRLPQGLQGRSPLLLMAAGSSALLPHTNTTMRPDFRLTSDEGSAEPTRREH